MQGLAEVVPVSSSAHLVAVPLLLGWPADPHRTLLAAGLHAGSCAGIALALGRPEARESALAAATCLPAAAAGLLVADAVERRLGRPGQLAALLGGAGVLLALADRSPQSRGVGPREAAAAGLAQVAALAPGVSRSGASLSALRALGVRRADAERFSLLMSLPVTAGAAALTLLGADRAQRGAVAPALLVGVPVAAATGWAGARWRRRRAGQDLVTFAVYRLALAAGLVVSARRRDRP